MQNQRLSKEHQVSEWRCKSAIKAGALRRSVTMHAEPSAVSQTDHITTL